MEKIKLTRINNIDSLKNNKNVFPIAKKKNSKKFSLKDLSNGMNSEENNDNMQKLELIKVSSVKNNGNISAKNNNKSILDDMKSVESNITHITSNSSGTVNSNSNLINKAVETNQDYKQTLSENKKSSLHFSESVNKQLKISQINEYKSKFKFNYRIMFYCNFFIILFSIFYSISRELVNESIITLNFFFTLNKFKSDSFGNMDIIREMILNDSFNKNIKTKEEIDSNFKLLYSSYNDAIKSADSIDKFLRENNNELSVLQSYLSNLNNASLCVEYAAISSLKIDPKKRSNKDSVIRVNDNNSPFYNVTEVVNKKVFTKEIFAKEIEKYGIFNKAKNFDIIDNTDYSLNKYLNFFKNSESILQDKTSQLPYNYKSYTNSDIEITHYNGYYSFCNSSIFKNGFTQGVVLNLDFNLGVYQKMVNMNLSGLVEKIEFLSSIDLENYLMQNIEIYLPLIDSILSEYSENIAKEKILLVFLMSKVKLGIVLSLCIILLLLYYKANLNFTQSLVFNRAILLLIPPSAFKKSDETVDEFMRNLD